MVSFQTVVVVVVHVPGYICSSSGQYLTIHSTCVQVPVSARDLGAKKRRKQIRDFRTWRSDVHPKNSEKRKRDTPCFKKFSSLAVKRKTKKYVLFRLTLLISIVVALSTDCDPLLFCCLYVAPFIIRRSSTQLFTFLPAHTFFFLPRTLKKCQVSQNFFL